MPKTTRPQLEFELAGLRLFIDNSRDLMFAVDRQYRLLAFNQAYQKAILASGGKGPVIGETVRSAEYPAEILTLWTSYYDRALAGETFTVERISPWQDGPHTIENSISPLRDAGGTIVGALVVGHDVTLSRQAEARLRRSEEDLNNAQRVGHLGSWRWNIQTNQLEWSAEMYRIFGVDQATFSGNLPEVVARSIHPDDRPAVELSNTLVAEQGQPSPLEYRVVRADGSLRWVWAEAGELVRDEAGSPAYLTGIVLDITERKQAGEEIKLLNATLEERVAQRTAQLETANRELEAISYSLAHDLRTPLRAINGYSTILAEEYHDQLDDRARRYLDKIIQTSLQIDQLNDDLRGLLMITRHRLALAPLDLSALAQGLAAELQAAEPGRAVTFRCSCSCDCTVQADRHLLQIGLRHLLENAWKFTRHTRQAEIEFGCRQQENRRIFFVRDNGAGFEMDYSDKLFGIFQRLHGAEEFEGRGIGLAVVKRIIHLHGGHIWAEGAPNQGAKFYFTLG